MANDRMYLMHRPTGKCVRIATHRAGSVTWEPEMDPEKFRALFEAVLNEDDSDDFCLATELCMGPFIWGGWEYTDDRGANGYTQMVPTKAFQDALFARCIEAATKVEVHKADVTFTYCKESEEVQGIVTAVFKELGLLPK